MSVEIFTKHKRPSHVTEKVYGKKIVETAGYISPKKQIENLIMAGERLEAYRSGMYDFPEGKIDEYFDDPTRDPDFDISDASALDRSVYNRLRDQELANRAKADEEAKLEKEKIEAERLELKQLKEEKKSGNKSEKD